MKQLIEAIEFLKTNEYRPVMANLSASNKYVKEFNKAVPSGSQAMKPLLVNTTHLEKNLDSTTFKTRYRYPVKFVADKEYRSLIASGTPEYFYLMNGQMPNAI